MLAGGWGGAIEEKHSTDEEKHSTGEGEQSTDKGKQYRVLTKINSVTSSQAGGVFRQLFLQCR